MKCLIENLEVNYPCSSVCRLYGDCMTAFLEEEKQRVRTNADCLRAMSDEELEEQLVLEMEGAAPCKMFLAIPTGEMFLSRDAARKVVGRWLRQPAEGE